MSEARARPAVSVSDQRARFAAAGTFFIAGAILGNWVPRIPDVKNGLNLSNGELGLALLGMAIGSLVAMQVTGFVMSRKGGKGIVAIMGPLFALSLLAVPTFSTGMWSLAFALLLVGIANGSLDIAMNGQGVAVERRYKRPIINGMHALFSLGGVTGAITGGYASSSQISMEAHFAAVAVVGILLSLATSHLLLNKHDEQSTAPSTMHVGEGGAKHAPLSAVLTRPTIVMGLLALAAFIAEGGIWDWVTVYMRDELGGSAASAAIAFGAFQGVMTVVRIFADRVVAKFGAVRVLRTSTAIGAVGLALGIVSQNVVLGIVGFAFGGLGVSVIVPLLFSAAGHAPSVDSSRTLATVSSFGFFGFFVGPPLLGAIADFTSLTFALFIPVVLIAVISLRAEVVQGASGGESLDTTVQMASADTLS